LLFFFSSRRRHTRSKRDWSSDVCSSDLVVTVIASITPFLLLFIVIISIYSFFTMEGSISELEQVAQTTPDYFPNWFIAAINYVSFNIAVGAGMALITGGAEKDSRVAGIGGLLGGLGIGIMII